MRSFILNSLKFIVTLLAIVVVCFAILGILIRKQANFTVKEDTEYIMIGHSHPECAYNDSLIDRFENLAISGEAYYYTFPKIKKLISQNPQIKMVFVEFTNNQLAKDVEKWIWTDKYLSYYYASYGPFLAITDKFLPALKNPSGYLTNLPIEFKDMSKKLIAGDINYSYEYGGFKAIGGTLDEYLAKKDTMQDEDFVKIDERVSDIQIHYLSKILDFLEQSEIEVVLVRTPQHSDYKGFKNENEYQAILNTEFENYNYIDLVDFPMSDDQFRDYEHLNTQGAAVISEWLNEVLNNSSITIEGHSDYQEINNKLK